MDEADKTSSNPQQLKRWRLPVDIKIYGGMISSGITIQVAFQIETMMMKF